MAKILRQITCVLLVPRSSPVQRLGSYKTRNFHLFGITARTSLWPFVNQVPEMNGSPGTKCRLDCPAFSQASLMQICWMAAAGTWDGAARLAVQPVGERSGL